MCCFSQAVDHKVRNALQQLRKQQDKRQKWLLKGHGEYQFLLNENEFFASMKGEEKMICHFFRDSWPCKVMDKHMSILCKEHMECKFAKVRLNTLAATGTDSANHCALTGPHS
jgi:hypothetical protein